MVKLVALDNLGVDVWFSEEFCFTIWLGCSLYTHKIVCKFWSQSAVVVQPRVEMKNPNSSSNKAMHRLTSLLYVTLYVEGRKTVVILGTNTAILTDTPEYKSIWYSYLQYCLFQWALSIFGYNLNNSMFLILQFVSVSSKWFYEVTMPKETGAYITDESHILILCLSIQTVLSSRKS